MNGYRIGRYAFYIFFLIASIVSGINGNWKEILLWIFFCVILYMMVKPSEDEEDLENAEREKYKKKHKT